MDFDRPSTERFSKIWSRVAETLNSQLGNDIFSSWFGRIQFESVHDGVAHLSVPTIFLAYWLKRYYKSHLLCALQAQMPEMRDVKIRERARVGVPLLKRTDPPMVSDKILPIQVPELTETMETTVSIEDPVVESAHGFRQPRMDEIVQLVGRFYGVSNKEIYSEVRTWRILLARQIAMYLIKKTVAKLSSQQIGKHFGGREHSTALHAVEKVKKLIEEDAGIARQIQTLSDSISVLQKT